MSETAIVFGSRLSPFVEKVVRALAIKGIDFEEVPPRGLRDFSRWNPQTKKMPVLELKGERTYDSTFILRRLDELVPEPPLIARDATTAARQRHLEDWSDESLYWYGMALRWTAHNAPATTAQILAGLPTAVRAIASLVLPRQIRATTVAQGLGRLPEQVLLRELGHRLDDLAVILGDKPFFYADRPSVADLAIHGQFHMLRSGPTSEAQALIDRHPTLVAHMRRLEEEARIPEAQALIDRHPTLVAHMRRLEEEARIP
jgi:glutathione S-transferase